MNCTTIVFCLALGMALDWLSPSASYAQRRPPPGIPPRAQSFFVTTFSGFSTDSGKSRLFICYRFPKNFLVFTRDSGPAQVDGYTARCDISIELRDTKGAPVAQRLTTRSFPSTENPEHGSDTLSFTGGFSVDLPPATYTAKFELTDLESQRIYRDDSVVIQVKNVTLDSLAVSDLLYIPTHADTLTGAIAPLNYGTTIPFGTGAGCYLQISVPDPGRRPNVSYEVYRQTGEGSPRRVVLRDSIPFDRFRPAREYTLAERGGTLTAGKLLAPGVFEGQFALNLDTLEQGNYELELRCSDGITDRRFNQRIVLRWIGMPFSLRSLMSAIVPMKYILPESEFDDLSSSGPEEQKRLFEAYWKRHDTTPSTAFNEMMEEFYKRVDHVMQAFATLREPNGARSDRGKVYILYGPPTRVERKLVPSSAPQEFWYYERLKKKVVFLDPARAGDYRLLSIEAL